MTSQVQRQLQKQKKPTNSWRVMTLGEVGEIVSGGTPSTAVSEYWGEEINWISPSDLTGYKNKTIKKGAKSITQLGLKNSSARIIPKGSVLFSSRAPIGYVVIAAEALSTNQGFKSIVPYDFVSSEYLYYFLSASKQQAEKVASGTTFKEISKSKFAELEIPIPDLATQQAIVSKIEELFSELDEGIESLKLAQQQLKVYRQSVLKWAFEGLPYLIFDKIIESSQNGLSKRSGTKGEPYKVLRLSDIVNNSITVLNPRKIVMDIAEIAKYKIKTEDLLCIRVNGSKDLVGKLVYVSSKNENENWAFCDHFIRFRLDSEKASSKFYHYYFTTVIARKYIQDNMVTSAGQNTVSQVTIKNMLVPTLNTKGQKLIIEKLENRFSLCDKMEETINLSLQQSEALRQSILKRAFEGKLA